MLFSLLRRPVRAAATVATALLAACDVPSSPPIFQQTWVVPGDSVVVGVSNLLPAEVAIDSAATPRAFRLTTTPGANISTTLGAVCGAPECQSNVTVTAPKPAFTSPAGVLGATINFPAGVNGVAISGGRLNFAITNNLGFDPIRPNGANGGGYGSLVVRITSGAAIARTDTIRGSATLGIPNGATTNLFLLLPTGNYASTLSVDIEVISPAGGNATMHRNNSMAVAASVSNLAMSSATVTVANKTFTTGNTAFDLSDVEFDAEDVENGGLRLTIINPFTAQATMNLRLTAPAQGGQPAVDIAKSVTIPAATSATAATSNATVILTQAELRSLLGKSNVAISGSGSASGTGAGNTVTATPVQEIKIRTQLQLTINVGGNN